MQLSANAKKDRNIVLNETSFS